jgi:type I restriction enzyme S subunit
MVVNSMSYATYDSYKESGVDWLGAIPSDWKLGRISTFFSERRQKVSDKDYPALSVTKLGVFPQWENVAKSNDGDNRKLVKKGDFVINSRSDRKGSSGIAKQDGSVSLINIVLKPMNIEPRYSEYLFKSYNFIEEFYRVGHGIVADLWTTRFDDIKNSMIALPTFDEQTKIANFLDEKTAQIDQAIALKQQQIEKLGEYKQIVIQNAVTKGLNPNAPMKDSGVEWIGDIPEHWEVKKLKYIAKLKSGDTFNSDDFKSTGYPVFGGNGLRGYTDKFNNSGDYILIGRQGALCGNVNYATGQFFATEHAVVVYPKLKYNLSFVGEAIKSANFGRFSNSAAQPGISVQVVQEVEFAFPSIDEQNEIGTFINEMEKKFDNTVSKYQTQIDRLKEYKNILINQAVTGKIKI